MHRKEFTCFDVAAVVRELKTIVPGSHVNNIYQLGSKTLLLKLHKVDRPALNLVLEAGRRAHLTGYAVEKPETPPAFCMALRKYLRGGWLAGVEQYEFERVVVFTFRTKNGDMRFVLELFGEGNMILVDGKGTILQALSYRQMRDRNILRGEAFSFPPPSRRNPLRVERAELGADLQACGDVEVVRALARLLGIGGVYAEETLLRARVDKTRHCSELTEGDADIIFENLRLLISNALNGSLEPCVVLDSAGAFVDVLPFQLKRYENANVEFRPFSTFNEALDEFYSRVLAIEEATAGIEVEELKREQERLKRVIAEQEKTLAEAEAKTETERRIGDAVYAHNNEVQALLDRFSGGKQEGKSWDDVVTEISDEKKAGLKPSLLFESFDAKDLIVNVCVDGLGLGLSLRKSSFENAAEFYELGKRAKQKAAGAKGALEESRRRLADVEAKIGEAERFEQARPAQAVEELAKRKVERKEWFEKFRWFVSSDGFLVVAGKDAVSNEVLVKKHAEAWDVVFHSDVIGAPFVVVKTEGKQPSQEALREAGEFAVAFSRGWREGFGSVDVYWVSPDQLAKGGRSGEFVPRGAFVVNGKRNWARNVLLRLAVGVIVKEQGEPEFAGGPVDAVKTKTNAYVLIGPGDLSGKELLRKIITALAGKVEKEAREKILKSSVEKVREFVPYGTGQILAN